MPTKLKKKVSTVTIPTSWLLAGALVLSTVVAAKAVYKASVQQAAPINEVKTTGNSNVQEGTYTGVVSREMNTEADGKGRERYVLTTSVGSKYVLIGLKQPYEPRENNKVVMPVDPQPEKGQNTGAQGNDQVKRSGRPVVSPVPKTTPRAADAGDVSAFEQYVGKTVTITGMVVPVSSNVAKPTRAPAASAVAKNGNQGGNGGNNSGKPMASAAVRTPKENNVSTGANWDIDRLIVKSVTVVQ